MKEYTTEVISISNAKPGMIVAKDIISNTGLTLIPMNTELNEKNIFKLKLYKINLIQIIQEVSNKKNSGNAIKNSSSAVIETKEFRAFQSSHIKSEETLKKQIVDISEGGVIDISELFSISNDLMDSIHRKNNLFAFLNNLQAFDDYTYSHSVNVSLISYTLGQWLGFNKDEMKLITVAGLLHDIGKTKIDINILNKPGKLTNDEFEEMKKHTAYGYQIVEKQDIPYKIKLAVLMHHEKLDGSGYPTHAKNSQISDYAKIMSIADIYDAMTSTRPYRAKCCPFKVIEFLKHDLLGKLDTKYLMTFITNIAYYYLDNWVKLSTGEEGKIVFINQNNPSKPIVKIDRALVDLSKEKDIFIEMII